MHVFASRRLSKWHSSAGECLDKPYHMLVLFASFSCYPILALSRCLTLRSNAKLLSFKHRVIGIVNASLSSAPGQILSRQISLLTGRPHYWRCHLHTHTHTHACTRTHAHTHTHTRAYAHTRTRTTHLPLLSVLICIVSFFFSSVSV